MDESDSAVTSDSDAGIGFELKVAAVLMLVGLAITVLPLASAYDSIQQANAGEQTDGTVVSTNIEQGWADDGQERTEDRNDRNKKDRVYYAQVTYNYTVDGQSYTSSTIKVPEQVTEPKGTEFDSEVKARQYLDDYQPRETITVYYLLDSPEDSYLETPEFSFVQYLIPVFFALPFYAAGIGLALYSRGIIGSSDEADDGEGGNDADDRDGSPASADGSSDAESAEKSVEN